MLQYICQFSDIFISRLKSEIPESLHSLTLPLIDLPIHTLDLSDNAFGPADAEALYPFLSQNVTLHTLMLNNNGLGSEGGKWIAKALLVRAESHSRFVSSSTTTTPTTSTSSTSTSTSTHTVLQSTPLSSTLTPQPFRCFYAGRNRLESLSMTYFADTFKAWPSLTHVSFPQNGIRSEGITSLMSGLRHCLQLMWLDVQDNTLTLTGSRVLANSLHLWPELRHLHLGDCLLTDQGGVCILKSLHQPLTHFYLSYNELTQKSFKALISYVQRNGHQLQVLEVNGNGVHPEGGLIETLRKELKILGKEHVLDELDDMDYDEDEEDEDENVIDEDEEEEKEEEKEEKEKVEKAEKEKLEKETFALEKALQKLSVQP